MQSLLLPTDLQTAIVWTQKEKDCTTIAIDPEKAIGTNAVKWLRENGRVRRQGRLKNLAIVNW